MIQVTKWREFQHYKHRHAPWIRLYGKLLDDRQYRELSGADRALLTDIWLLASETLDGCLHDASTTLAWRLRMDTAVFVASVQRIAAQRDDDGEVKWIVIDASRLLAGCEQLAPKSCSETETETEAEAEAETEKKAAAVATFQRRFSAADAITVENWLCQLRSEPAAAAWIARFSGYLHGLDMPAGKRATPLAIATALRDLGPGDHSPAKVRRFIERAMAPSKPIVNAPVNEFDRLRAKAEAEESRQ